MSTNAFIGILNNDNTIDCVYVHFDGYIEHVGKILKNFYKTNNKIKELIKNCSIISLYESIEKTKFYNISNSEIIKFSSIKVFHSIIKKI